MPIYECHGGNGQKRWKIGSHGECMYTSEENAKKAYVAYLAQHPEDVHNPISFDFDQTLTRTKYRFLAEKFIREGKKVLIITARNESNSREVYKVADELGIPHSLVYFTNGEDKWKTIQKLNVTTHYDNNPEQINKINKFTKTLGILAD